MPPNLNTHTDLNIRNNTVYRDESTHTNILFMCFSVFLCVFLFYLSLFSWFPPSAQMSFHTIPIKQSKIAIERDVEEESVIFKHGEECVSGTDSVRVAQKWRKFKSHAEILREEGAYVTVAFQYSCPKCWLKESQFHLMFFGDKKNRHTAKTLGEFSLHISVTSEARRAFQVPLCIFVVFSA